MCPQQKGGNNEKVDLSSFTSSTINRCLRGLVCSSRAEYAFAIAKSLGNPADRLHQRRSALPIRTCLGLSSAFGMLLCTLRPLLRRALAVSVTPVALALLGDQKQDYRYGLRQGEETRAARRKLCVGV